MGLSSRPAESRELSHSCKHTAGRNQRFPLRPPRTRRIAAGLLRGVARNPVSRFRSTFARLRAVNRRWFEAGWCAGIIEGFDPYDPKLEKFVGVLVEKNRLPNNKALVFSTFRHTLSYLAQHTGEAGLRFGLIHGDVPDEERAELRRRFALPKDDSAALDVLLSSEVGCEGLDFQFCDFLVNYDLPWNPMRIEQRIGRIDRYGQRSETVAIVNFVTPGTVDADIYERCLVRIGVFRHAIGGNEEILGEITKELRSIWSPTFSFSISNLVLPTALSAAPSLEGRTRFEFPFNNHKKCARDAHQEILAGLTDFHDTTLMFLSHLKLLSWHIGQHLGGEVRRIAHSEHHVEGRKQTGRTMTVSSHFIRFSRPVKDHEKQTVTVAFALEYLPGITQFDSMKPLNNQFRICAANPGLVAVFFPAEKETSGLRFHVHAPFVPELSRASVKDTPVNDPLFEQLAEVAAGSLHTIRNARLLNGDFLGVLPNPQDSIPPRYEPIRSAMVAKMNNEDLTPTHVRSHAPAKTLLQAKAALKELLSVDDLRFLRGTDEGHREWAIGASQKNSSQDRFLSGLAITDWEADKLVEQLKLMATYRNADLIAWISVKSVDWHQHLYSILLDMLQAKPEWQRPSIIGQIKRLPIIRLSDGRYTGGNCYFPAPGIDHTDGLPRVDKGVYSAGKTKTHQQDARKFLELLGVHEVEEVDQIEAILNQRYTADACNPDPRDLERFIAFIEKEPTKASMFRKFYIFERTDGKWGRPSDVFLDSPYVETGLCAYYDARGAQAERLALSGSYQKGTPSNQRVRKFAEVLLVQSTLAVTQTSCVQNVDWREFQKGDVVRGSNDKYRRVDKDYDIAELELLLNLKTEEASRLIWTTMTTVVKPEQLIARWQRNNQSSERTGHSQLVQRLRASPWIPQGSGIFATPRAAVVDLLPKNGFPFEAGYEWLKAIGFGEDARQQSDEFLEKQSTAIELGFADEKSLADGRWFAELDPDERKRVIDEIETRRRFELPENIPRDPEHRAQRVGEFAANAPERTTEERTRSVSIGLGDVKHDAAEYLRENYSIDGEMICQICHRPLPFKLDDGTYYFEKVQILSELVKWHYQNYIALCPNHSAMFQHANSSRRVLKQNVIDLAGNHLTLVLAQKDAVIYFTRTHIEDLKAVIEADRQLSPESDDR